MATRTKSASAERKIRYAVVGLGWFAQAAMLPAFAHARNSELVALVSDDATKLKQLGKKYGAAWLGGYDEFERILKDGAVDAVYIALPNMLHREFTERAARAGVHVLCEKPMAVTSKDCEAMMVACEQNDVKLMIAYRLHFERANMTAVEVARSGKIGDARLFSAVFTQQVVGKNIRLQDHTGGGTLGDIGIYCINAARYIFRAEPTEVFAMTARSEARRFDEVEEMTGAILRFPDDRLATIAVSFGAASVSSYRVVGTKGDMLVEPAFGFVGERRIEITTGKRTNKRSYVNRDQLAPELVYFSDCILEDKKPEPSGVEGAIDVRIIEALYRSAKTGKFVALEKFARKPRPSMKQHKFRPPVPKAELVHAEPPEGE